MPVVYFTFLHHMYFELLLNTFTVYDSNKLELCVPAMKTSPTSVILLQIFSIQKLCGAHCEHFETLFTEVFLKMTKGYLYKSCSVGRTSLIFFQSIITHPDHIFFSELCKQFFLGLPVSLKYATATSCWAIKTDLNKGQRLIFFYCITLGKYCLIKGQAAFD